MSSHTAVDISSLLPPQPRDYLILFALADGPLHGHGILKAVENETGGVMLDPANLYRSLHRLERDGLIVRNESDASGHGRRREVELTELGRQVLIAEAERIAQLADAARERKLVGPAAGLA